MSKAEERARDAGWEVGNADRLNGMVVMNDDVVLVEVNLTDLERYAGVCSPYSDPEEHYGTMQKSVLDAHDKLVDVLFKHYVAGYRDGATNTITD